MTALEKYIEKMKKELPEICQIKHLIDFGYFSSYQQAYELRKKGNGPEFFKKNGHYCYYRDDIIRHLTIGSAE